MRIVENILAFLSKNKKNIFYILLFVLFFFHSNDFAFAEETKDKESANTAIKALNAIISGASFILAFLTMLIGLFLRPEWTSGSVIGLDTQLKTLWILISNVVYLVFAGIFVTIAFMNIIGHSDQYELKKAIPKFIVGVLIVPFSWFFVQFILSLSSILTVSVLSLPYDTFPELNLKKEKIPVCAEGWKVNMASGSGATVECKGGGKPVGQTIEEFLKKGDNGGLFSIMYIYTYGVMRLDEKSLLVAAELKKGITDIWSLGLKLSVDLLFIIVYLLLLVALFLAFMVRGIALWFYIIFSPLFGLLHFFGHGKDGMGDGPAKKFNLTEFIGLAFVPVYVAAALSFGLLFLFVAGKGFTESAGQNIDDKKVYFKGDVLVIDKNELSGDAIKGIAASPENNTLAKGFTGPIGALFLEMLGLAVLWVAVMAALHQSKITEGVSGPISHFGDEIGKLVAKAPTYAPILPGGLSAQGLQQVGSSAGSYFQSESTKNAQNWMKEKGLFQSPDVNASSKAGLLADEINREKRMDKENLDKFTNAVKDFSDLNTMSRDKNAQRMLTEAIEKLNLKDKDELIKGLSTPQGMAKAIAAVNNITPQYNANNLGKTHINDQEAFNYINGVMKGAASQQSTPQQPSMPTGVESVANKQNQYVVHEIKDGKPLSNSATIEVKNGKIDDGEISRLAKILKSHDYTSVSNTLNQMGITDPDVIKKLNAEILK